MNTEEEFSDSDSNDEDYVPNSKIEDAVSEVESDGDPEDSEDEANKKGGKRTRKALSPKKKKAKIAEEKNDGPDTHSEATTTTEDPKQKADDLWADFMKDTGFTSKKSKETSPSSSQISKTPTQSTSRTNKKETEPEKPADKVKITQIFEFAGEEVKVEKEVDANSAEARLLSKAPVKKKTANLNGLGNVLNQLGKKQKISTLEKTKLDWEKFKKDENIIEELEVHNKGKDGYLERQDFLQRADVRRFEIEKDLRSVERAKRLN